MYNPKVHVTLAIVILFLAAFLPALLFPTLILYQFILYYSSLAFASTSLLFRSSIARSLCKLQYLKVHHNKTFVVIWSCVLAVMRVLSYTIAMKNWLVIRKLYLMQHQRSYGGWDLISELLGVESLGFRKEYWESEIRDSREKECRRRTQREQEKEWEILGIPLIS